MFKKFLLVNSLLFICASGFAATHPLRIVVDPGHGGVDDGAIRGKVREADIALKISTELASLLRANEHTVVMTRQSDKAISLKQRTQIAESEKADLFISIHANASEDPRAKGVEFYFQNTLQADEEAAFLANKENQAVAADPDHSIGDSDVAQILADLQRNYKAQSSFDFLKTLADGWSVSGETQRKTMIRQAPFYVVAQTTMPSVLVEVGFVSHKSEAQLLMQRSHQREIAAQIAQAVEQYKAELPEPAIPRSLASP